MPAHPRINREIVLLRNSSWPSGRKAFLISLKESRLPATLVLVTVSLQPTTMPIRKYLLILAGLALGLVLLLRLNHHPTDDAAEGALRSQPVAQPTAIKSMPGRVLAGLGSAPGLHDVDERAMASLRREDPEALAMSLLTSWNEPFSPELLALAAQRFGEAKNSYAKFQLAMLLHRYGKSAGTEFLRGTVRQAGSEYQETAAQALAMSRDRGSVGLLADHLRSSVSGTPVNLLRELGTWREPELIEALKFAFHTSQPRSPAFAKALALMGEFGPVDGLAGDAWLYSPEYEKPALAIRRNSAANPGWIAGLLGDSVPKTVPTEFLIDACRTAGAAAAAGPVESWLRQYASAQVRSNSDYREHIRAIRANEKEWSVFEFDDRPFRLAVSSIRLLGEWAQPSSAEAVYDYLGAYLAGKYSPAVVEQIIATTASVDPRNFESRLQALGIAIDAISTALAVAKLNPLPLQFLPRQISKLAPIRIPGED